MILEEKTYNAKIRFAWLGTEPDSTCLTIQFGFEYEKGVINTTKKTLKDIREISVILSVLGVNSWEELQRKFVRIKVTDRNVLEIGNIIENEWLKWNETN